MVVTAPPGTGKTTFVPPLVAERTGGRVVVTQPRRVAVRAAARRLARLHGSAIGDAVGYTVRGERQRSAATRVEFVTPGVLLRRLLADPALDGISCVVIDEVHERAVESDLLLAMLAEVCQLRDDLSLVAMSATFDAGLVADLLGGAPIVEVPAPLHPLRVEYEPGRAPRLDARGVTREFLGHVTELAATARTGGDALVFVPGAREVDDVAARLRAHPAAADVEVLALHGRLAVRDQDRATSGRRDASEPRRIIVTTAIAESSLTVPGVDLVVDAGLARAPRRDAGRGMTGLVTVSASRASAEQRAGRAARQGPGRVIRAYSATDFARMPAADAPEIAVADLTDAALLLAAWGTPGADGLRLLTSPPPAALRDAVETLRALELVDDAGRVTPLGARVARMPVGARAARALLEAGAWGVERATAAEVIAACEGGFRDPDADLGALLRGLRRGSVPGSDRWRAEARRLAGLARAPEARAAAADDVAPGLVVALSRPDWIARRTAAGSRTYLLASGTRVALPEGSGLIHAEWLAVHEVQLADGRAADGTGAVIRLAAPIDGGSAERAGAGLARERRAATIEDGRLRVRSERRLGAILLSSTPVAATSEDRARAHAAHVRDAGLAELRWTQDARALRGRLALVRRELGDPWPAMDDESLLAAIDDWLLPAIAAAGRDAALTDVDVERALRALLPWPDAARLDELAPERLAVPSGSRVRIAYPGPDDPDGRPVVPVKLQEVFGLARTPRLVDGRVPVLFHLLSPARRPLAVTDDLESFWNGPYRQVRKEMRGRYPKHPWPEDPWSAVATARTSRASGR